MGYYHDADGVLNEVSEWKSGLWIEPKSIADPYVVIPLPNENKENISEADFCSRKGVKKNCHGWGIEGFRGLEIKIDYPNNRELSSSSSYKPYLYYIY